MSDIYNISNLYVGAQGIYLCGFPKLDLVETVTDSIEQFYQEKIKPSICTFRLLPRSLALKQPSRITGSLLQNVSRVAEQFQYQQDVEGTVISSASRKKGTTVGSLTQPKEKDFILVKRTPIMRVYQPSNPVLKDEYTVLEPIIYRKMTKKQEEALCRDRIQQWIDIGYHVNIMQAFKLQNAQGRLGIFVQKVNGKTLRDWIQSGFFQDKNKIINSKRVLNVLLQLAIGLDYLHRKQFAHQQFTPDNVYVQNQKCLKIGNMYNFNGGTSKQLCKSPWMGSSPQYWSYQQGQIFESIRHNKQPTAYQNALKLIPEVSCQSDIYQLGLIAIELGYGRFWSRGDKLDFTLLGNMQCKNLTNETISFILDQTQEMVSHRPQERPQLSNFIGALLDFYQQQFKNPQDLLWMKYFDEVKYESDLLNNKAVGLYLAGNQLQCQKTWIRSLLSNPRNLVAQYNYSHYKRMKRAIDDVRLNKQLFLLPQSRKRNYYLLISNLVTLPLLRQPFKTYNFNPKLSRGKQIQLVTNIIQQLSKSKKPKEYMYQRRYLMGWYKFQAVFLINSNKHFIGRLKDTNTLLVWNLIEELRPFNFYEAKAPKDPVVIDSRTSLTTIDNTFTYLAISQNNYLCIFKVDILTDIIVHYELKDYGSNILAMEFDMRTQVIALGSNQFNIRLINLVSKEVYKMINVGQRFVISNIRFYDRNSCLGFSCQKSIIFHRIESSKPLFTIRCSGIVSTYRTIEATVNSHFMIVLTLEKFEVWNLKDKVLLRNIEIDEAPNIKSFSTLTGKKIVIHYGRNMIRIWNYSNGLILKSYKSPSTYAWMGVSQDNRYLQSLTDSGTLTLRNIDFDDFLKNFDGVCLPNQLSFADDRDDNSDEINNYIKYGKILIKHLNEYRLNDHDKKVSLDGMYSLAQTIKSQVFFQDKTDMKTIFKYLNSLKQQQQKSSKINAHSEQFIFTSRKDEVITCVSNYYMEHFAIGQSTGTIRIVSPPNNIVSSLKPFSSSISFINLDQSTLFIGCGCSCVFLQRESMSVVVSHNSYHKNTILFGTILNNILITADDTETILYWNKDKVRRYSIPVILGDCVGNKLLLSGTDNRIRLYEVNDQGLRQVYVFIGHVMPVYRMTVIDDGIFASYSLDGTVRWWNVAAKLCFNHYNFKRYMQNDKLLFVDLPQYPIEQQKNPQFDRQGSALLLINNAQVAVFDIVRKQIKFRLQLTQDINRLFWTDYPNSFAAVTNSGVRIYNLYWRYTVNKKQS